MKRSFERMSYYDEVAQGFADSSFLEFFQNVRIYCKNKKVLTMPLVPLISNSSWLRHLLKEQEVHTIVEIILPDFNQQEVQFLFDLLMRGRSRTYNPNYELVSKISLVAKAFGFNMYLDQSLQKVGLIVPRIHEVIKKATIEHLHDTYLCQSYKSLIICRICRRTFGDSEGLQGHLAFEHNQTPKFGLNCNVIKEESHGMDFAPESYENMHKEQCIFCSEKFQTKEELLHHVQESYYRHGFRKLFGWSKVNFCVICSKVFRSLDDRCSHAILEHHILDLIHLKRFSDEIPPYKKPRISNKKFLDQQIKSPRLVRFDKNIQYDFDKKYQRTDAQLVNSTKKLKGGIMKTRYSSQPNPPPSNTVRAHTILNGITSFFMPDATDLYREQRSDFDRQIVQRFLENVNRIWGLDS